VTRYDSLEKAQRFGNSEAYQKILPIRLKNAISRLYLVEGVVD
jgi:uncharacterized protein (DUF1330 family)